MWRKMYFRKVFLAFCLINCSFFLFSMDSPDDQGPSRGIFCNCEEKGKEESIKLTCDDIRFRGSGTDSRKNTYFKSVNDPMDPKLAQLALAQAPLRVKKMIHAIRFPVFELGAEGQNLLLFVGPPGSGKSTLARAIAHQYNISCTTLQASLLSTEYRKSAEQNLMRAIDPILEGPESH